MKGVLSELPKETIGIVVANSFTSGAIRTAQISIHNIILTDEENICEDLLEFVTSREKFYFSYIYFSISFIIIIFLHIINCINQILRL